MKIQSLTGSEALDEWFSANFREHTLAATGESANYSTFAFEAVDEEGTRLGACSGNIYWGCMNISRVMIAPEHRRAGVGTALISHILRWHAANGGTMATVETLDYQGREYYPRFGFKLEFVREGYKHGRCLYVFSRPLTADDAVELRVDPAATAAATADASIAASDVVVGHHEGT
jgi:GNAT superfamily N-acetyltransferase